MRKLSKIVAATLVLALGGAGAAIAAPAAPSPDEAAFMAQNQQAMDRMMAGMAAAPSGDVDRDFVAMMVPHHQGAIDMALLELRYGHNETLRRMAQEIIVDQRQEITAMHLAIGQPLPSATAPDQPASATPGMAMPPAGGHGTGQ